MGPTYLRVGRLATVGWLPIIVRRNVLNQNSGVSSRGYKKRGMSPEVVGSLQRPPSKVLQGRRARQPTNCPFIVYDMSGDSIWMNVTGCIETILDVTEQSTNSPEKRFAVG